MNGSDSADAPRRTRRERSEIAAELREGGGAVVYEQVLEACERARQDPVLVGSGQVHDGRGLADDLVRLTRRLHAQGAREGDVALLAVRPGVEMLTVVLALMRIGVVVTPLDRGAGPRLFESRLELLQPSWIFAESLVYAASARPLGWLLRSRGLDLPDIGRIGGQHVVVGPSRWGAPSDAISWSDLIGGKGRRPVGAGAADGSPAPTAELPIPVPAAREPASIVFTSGTTGAPKGVQHSGASAAGAISLILENLEPSVGSVFSNQSVHSTIATLLAGAPTVFAPLDFRPARWLRDAALHGITHAFLRPWDAFRLADHCARRGRRIPDGLQQIYLYSAPVTPTLLRRLHAVGPAHLRCTSVYGTTEALPISSIDSEARLAWDGEGDLVGRPLTGVEVRVGKRGTLEVRGPQVHLGYLGMARCDWHDTGDFARIEADGSVVLLGRAKDMILRDSFNIYPALYEPTISTIPGIGECAMVGVADPDSGDERVILFVTPDESPTRSAQRTLPTRVGRALRRGSHRIDHKALPDEIFVLGRLPRSRRGKVDRVELRRQARARTDSAGGEA